MKSKKLISLLCAAALTVSSFAGLATTASAATEEDILWSDTFDGSATTGIFLTGQDSGPNTNSDIVEGLTFVTTNRGGGDCGIYTDANGTTVYGGSYYAVLEKEDASDKYLRLSVPVFGDYEDTTKGRWGHVDFTDGALTATAEKDVVMDFDIKMTDGKVHGVTEGKENVTNPVLRVGTFDANVATAVKIDKDALSIGDDWVHARIIVSDSTGATLYIEGVEASTNPSVKSIASLGLYSSDGLSSAPAMFDLIAGGFTPDDGGSYTDADLPSYTPVIDLDNVIVYNEAAGVATADSKAPGAQTSTGGATPVPTEAPTVIEAAPSLTAPEGVDNLESYNFDDNATAMWTLGTEERNITDVPGLTVHIGARASGGATDTYAAVTEIATGNVLQMQAGRFSTVARAPRMSVDTSMPVADGASTVMAFNVRLSAAKGHGDDAQPRLYFIKNTDQQGSDGQGAYRNVAAVLTAVEGDEIYRGDDTGSDKISAYITPDEWHTVVFIVSPTDSGATHRLYIDGAEDPAVKCDYVATGENATTMDNLPILTPESKASKVGGVDTTPNFGLVTIDNLLAYQGVASEPRRLLPTTGEAPTPAPTEVPLPEVEMTLDADTKVVSMTSDMDATAYLVQASYDTEGALVAVKAAKEVSLKAAEAVTETLETLTVGDKIMLWNNLKDITPIADAIVAAAGDAQATPVPTPEPTEVPTEAPTATPEVTETTTPTDTPVEPTEAPTPTPVPTEVPTPTPVTYAVTVAETTNGTASVDKAVAAEGDTVTITTKANLGYEATVSVKDADNADVTVTEGKFTMPAKAVTVTVTFAAKENTILSTDSTYISRYGKNDTNENEVQTQVTTNYNAETKVFVGSDGNYNAIGLYKFAAPTISADKQIASAKLTLVNQSMNNTNGDSSVNVNYPNVSTGIDFSTITWYTMFTSETLTNATASVWSNLAEGAPFQSVTNLATVTLAKAETNATHADIDVTSYVKEQTKKGEEIVLVLNKCSRGANFDKVAMIEYTLEDKKYETTVTAPAETDGTLSVDVAEAAPGATVTVTATPAAGKKVTGVTVAKAEGTVEVTEADGKYTFTMPAEAVTISATFDRADIATLTVEGADTASTGSTSQYTVVAKAADGTVLTPNEGEITWAVEGATANTTIAAGLLTVAADETTNPETKEITVKATAGTVEGTLKVTIVDLPTYAITTATELVGGSVTTDVNASIEGGKVVVTPTALAGYAVSKVTYQDVPAAPEAVALKYNAEQVENGRDKDETDTYTFVEGADAAAKALFADATDATKVDATYTTKAEDYIGTNDGNKGLPTVNVTAAAGTYKLYYLGYNNDTTPITATIGDQTVSFGAGVNFAAGVTSPERVLKIYTADLVLAEAVTDATLTLGTSAAAAWLPDLYAVAITGTPNATAPTVTEVTATEGVYSFEMPAYPVVVSAEFEKVDLAITNGTAADANGTITVAEKAKLGDTVEIAVTPNGGYELATLTFKGTAEGSTVAETAITAKDGVYSFTMPSEAVTVTATFVEKPMDDVLPASYDAASLVTVYSNATQTVRDGNRSVTELAVIDTSDNDGFATQANFSDSLKSAVDKKIYFAFDVKISAGDVLKFRFTSGSATSNQGPTCYLFEDGNGKLNYIWQTGSNQGYGESNQAANTKATELVTDTWYRVVVSGMRNQWGNMSSYDMNVYAYTDAGAVADTASFTAAGLGGRNTNKAVNSVNIGSKLGTPVVDNTYIYTDPYYAATVNVTAGDPAAAVEGATVTVKLGDVTVATGNTTAEGTFTANLQTGTYSVVVEKAGYVTLEDGSLTVTADGGTAAVTLEENTASPASLFVSYRTNADDAQTEIAKVEYALENSEKFAGQEITVADSVKATQIVVNADTKKSKAYTYVSGVPTEALTLVAGENTLVIVVETDGVEYDYYEDFSAMSDLGSWNNAGGNYRISTLTTEEKNTFLRGAATLNQAAQMIHDLGTPIALTGKTVTVEFDLRVPEHTKPGTGEVSLGDSDKNLAIAIGQHGGDSANYAMGYYTGGTMSTDVGNSGNWGVNANSGSFATVKAESYNGTGWYHIKVVFEGGKASVTVTDSANPTDTTTVSDIEVASTNIQYIKLAAGKAQGGTNNKVNANTGDLDNVTITSVDTVTE